MIDAYTTNAILGGITIAIELEVAINAVENGAGKSATLDHRWDQYHTQLAATVAGPKPRCPKKHTTITHTITIPPLVVSHAVSTKRIGRLEIPAFAMIYRNNTKNGIASNRNLLMLRNTYISSHDRQ